MRKIYRTGGTYVNSGDLSFGGWVTGYMLRLLPTSFENVLLVLTYFKCSSGFDCIILCCKRGYDLGNTEIHKISMPTYLVF